MSIFHKYVLKLISNSDDSSLTDNEMVIKRDISIKEFEASKSPTDFSIHSDEVKDILESITVKEDTILLNSYILGLRELSEIENKLNMLPFDGDKEKIIESRQQRDLAKKIESSKNAESKKKDNKTGIGLAIAFVFLIPILSYSMTQTSSSSGEDSVDIEAAENKTVDNIICGKEVKEHLSDIFDKNSESIKGCKSEGKSTIVRVSALVLPTGSFDEIIS